MITQRSGMCFELCYSDAEEHSVSQKGLKEESTMKYQFDNQNSLFVFSSAN